MASSIDDETVPSDDVPFPHNIDGTEFDCVITGECIDAHFAEVPFSRIFEEHNYHRWLRVTEKVEEKVARGEKSPITVSVDDF